MSSPAPPSDSKSMENLTAELQDLKQKINLLGLLNTNLIGDLTGLQKTVRDLETAVKDLRHNVRDLERSTIDRQKAIEANALARLANGFITKPFTPLLRLRDPLNRHIAEFPLNMEAIRNMKLEDVGTLLAAFDMPIDDVSARDKRLLAAYIGVNVELL